jgi:hypothetical protein
MNIRDEENALFTEWKKTRPNFIPDGIINEKGYLNSPLKVLYILKDVNGGEGWDLRKYVDGGGRAKTLNNIARWQYAIEHFKEDIPFSKVDNISQSFREKHLKNIAIINLKKEPGGPEAINDQIWTYSWDDKSFIVKQIVLYKPDVVICCGTGEMVRKRELITPFKKWNWSLSNSGVEYYKNEILILKFVHPQQRKFTKKKLFNMFLETIRELKNLA